MELYKKFKGMSKKAKLGLVGTALYTTTSLALPAYAVVKQDLAEVKPISAAEFASIDSFEKADKLYNEKLSLYAGDNLLVHAEISRSIAHSNKARRDIIATAFHRFYEFRFFHDVTVS